MNNLWEKLCAFAVAMSTALSISFFSHSSRAQEEAYGAYGHYPVGTTRVLGMGGAFVGLADDASAVVTNPAGLSLTNYVIDYTGGENRIINREQLFGQSIDDREGIPYTSQFRAVSVRLGFLGIAYSVPYALDYDAAGALPFKRTLRVENYDVAAALRFSTLSIGATAHMERVDLAYKTESATLLEQKKESVYPTFGILYDVGKKGGVGVTYTPQRRYNFDESMDSRIDGMFSVREWFHDVVIPGKLTFGASLWYKQKLRWVADVDVYEPVKDAILVGGTSLTGQDRIVEKTQTVMHGGFEFWVEKTRNLDFIWRGGGYNEPARVAYMPSRFHFTMGVEIRYYFLVLAASYDQAPDFSNVSQSVGISLGAL